MASNLTTEFPGYDHLYWLRRPDSAGKFVADLDLGGLDERKALRGELVVESAGARWAAGSGRPGNIVWTRFATPILLSPTIHAELQLAELSGWTSYGVSLVGKHNEALGAFQGLTVLGRCGAIQKERSAIVYHKFPGGDAAYHKGLFFEEGSWDGSDFFMAKDSTAFVFLSENARAFMREWAPKARLTPLSDVEMDSSVWL